MTDTQSAQDASDSKDFCLALINTETSDRCSVSVEEVFDELQQISLSGLVPVVIHKQFNAAKDVTLYSCFSTTYKQIADNKVTSTLVAALSLRLGKEGHRLKWLMKMAVDMGLITSSKFEGSKDIELPDLVNKLCDIRVSNIGSSHSDKIENLRFCAYMINQLYG